MIKSKEFYENIYQNNKNCVRKYEDGEITIFTYTILDYDFLKNKEHREIRGITFVNDKPYLSLPKFFNVNEIEETQFHLIKDKKIKYISEKMDGSLITFYEKDGNIYPKTKNSLRNDILDDIYNKNLINNDIIEFVRFCFDNNYYPIFEYISPDNKIVIDYDKSELILTVIRDSEGNFIRPDILKFQFPNIEYTKVYDNLDINNIMSILPVLKEREGFVVVFEDNTVVKFKTDEYFELHHLFNDVYRDIILLRLMVEEKIDDFISKIEHENVKEMVMNKLLKFNEEVTKIKNEVNILYNSLHNIYDIKYVAERYKKHNLFHFLMTKVRNKDLDKYIKNFILRKFNGEKRANEFFKKGV